MAKKTADPRAHCPNRAKHTPCPDGYVAWHEWAAKKARTHRQTRCTGCDRLSIWVPLIRALSVRQPWAAAIAHLGKTVENRSWPTNHRGPVAIHASAALDEYADHAVQRICDITGRTPKDVLAHDVRGAIVAIVDITGCHQHTCPRHPCDHAGAPICAPWADRGQWHWELADTRPLPQPIPARGRLGLWPVPEPIDAQVRAALNLEEATHGR
jgi:hypothetical protein